VHNSVSLDGQNVGFAVDIGLHYEVAQRWSYEAHLVGSNTILQGDAEIPPDDEAALQPAAPIAPNDKRALLVVADSRGRLSKWRSLRQQPYWRGGVALCSRSTPQEYLDYVTRCHVPYLIAGDDQVDFREALELLNRHFGVKTVLVDSGGTLNGLLLREGLVDEVSLLIHPTLIGGTTPRSFFRAPEDTIPLRLTHVEPMRDGIVWVRYEVAGSR
jgi:2,5-diamino-6-(ribosylamino)-4(3H)-pyrimidinone 5'-phosphate reductase